MSGKGANGSESMSVKSSACLPRTAGLGPQERPSNEARRLGTAPAIKMEKLVKPKGGDLRELVLPGGGEWFLQGEDGVGQPDVRLLLQTDDDAYIYVRYSGVLEFNETAMSAISEGRSTNFGDNLFLTQVRFESSDPNYAWLSKTIAVGEGRMHSDCVEYAIYEVAHD